jgi:hypothetical protein
MDEWLHIRAEEGVSLRLHDLSGRLVKEISLRDRETLLSVAELEAGTYVLEIRTTKGRAVKLLVKN